MRGLRGLRAGCPVEAIYYEDDLPDEWKAYTGDNARFFTETLPGQTEPLGSPGGAARWVPWASIRPGRGCRLRQ